MIEAAILNVNSATLLRGRIQRIAQYKLHCVGASGNSYKVALYLNCAGLDWEPVGVDFGGGQTRDVNWRATTNTMGEVPVLEVTGKRMAQSGAIFDVAGRNHRQVRSGQRR